MQATLSRRAFLEARRSGVGGSDVGAIVGVHPFGKNALDVFREKTDPAVLDEPLTPPQLRGISLEPIICDMYAEAHHELRVLEMLPEELPITNPDYPWLISNPDRVVFDAPVGRGPHVAAGLLEAKCPGIGEFAKLKTDGISHQYQLQAQEYMLVTAVPWVDFVFLNAERWQKIECRIEANPEVQKLLAEATRQFWYDHVLTGKPPAPDSFNLDLPPAPDSVVWIEDEERQQAVLQLRDAKRLKKETEALEEMAVERMKVLLGTLGTFVMEGDTPDKVHKLVHYAQEGRRTFDDKRLALHAPLDPVKVAEILDRPWDNGQDPGAALADEVLAAKLDLEQFYNQGEPFSVLRLYPNAKR